MKRVSPRAVLSCGTGSVALFALALAEANARPAPAVEPVAAVLLRGPAPVAGPSSTG